MLVFALIATEDSACIMIFLNKCQAMLCVSIDTVCYTIYLSNLPILAHQLAAPVNYVLCTFTHATQLHKVRMKDKCNASASLSLLNGHIYSSIA